MPPAPIKTVSFDSQALQISDIYKLLIGCVIPRPIAFVTSQNAAGQGNLAPFSFFNAVCSNPPIVSISFSRRSDGGKKDSLLNIEETGEFVVNSAGYPLLDAVAQSAADYPRGTDEREITGLHTVPSVAVKVPRLAESEWSFECVLHQKIELGDGTAGSSTLVLGRVVMFHIDERARDERGRIDPAVLDPIARLGGISYTRLGERLERAVPKV